MRIQIRYILLFSIWLSVGIAIGYAQLVTYPISTKPDNSKLQLFSYQESQAGDTISLPFLDDFSSPSRQLNLAWWQASSKVWVNNSMGLNPPSIGVATFDGNDPNGRPYVRSGEASGFGDSLVSLPINMAAVPSNKRNTVVLSFYWQKKGLGEEPDQEDVFQLLFKNNQGTWNVIWEVNGLVDVPTDSFQFKSIAIESDQYFHSGFQFAFRSSANLTGPFDTWNLDYVWLDQDRKLNNRAVKDRALSSLLKQGLFGNYSQVPAEMARNFPSEFIDTTFVEFNNLDSLLQPIEYSTFIRDARTGNIVQQMNNRSILNPIPEGFERRNMQVFPLNPSQLPEGDSLALEFHFQLISGDTLYRRPPSSYFQSIDFRSNDSFTLPLLLHESLAYDDGTAEFAVGINQNGGRVAYQYWVPEMDIITAIDVNFPFIPGGQEGRTIELLILKSLGRSQEDVLQRQTISIPAFAGRDSLSRITLERPTVVQDTFYIGWRHIGIFPIAVGLDKDYDTSDMLFANVTGIWEPVRNIVGSLMFRPVFNKGIAVGILDKPSDAQIQLYPNPAGGWVNVISPYENYQLMDMTGRMVLQGKWEQAGQHQLNIERLRPGIYVFRSFSGKFAQQKKLIIR